MAFEFEHSLTFIHSPKPCMDRRENTTRSNQTQYTLVALVRLRIGSGWMGLTAARRAEKEHLNIVIFFAIINFVFCSGKMPYSGLGGMEVVDFLKLGHRLKQPEGCPAKM